MGTAPAFTMAMTVNEKSVKEWLAKLPNFDAADPKPGNYHIFLCPETGMVFKSREDTKVYTRKTAITDFLSIWAQVKTGPAGKWSIGKIGQNAPDAADTIDAQKAEAEWRRERAEKARLAAEKKVQDDLREHQAAEIAAKAAQEMAASERIAYERKMAEEAAAKAAEEKAALEAAYRDRQVGQVNSEAPIADDVVVRHVGAFENAYGKWVNDKLTRGGFNPIQIDNMLEEFYNGTVLKNLLTCLAPNAEVALKKVEMRPHNRFVVSSNYSIMWPFMTDTEKIDLGGINALNVWGNRPQMKTLLNLIHKLQVKYDNEAGRSGLLEWCKPRCAKYKNVNNFGSDWSDGTAFLALYDSHFNTSLPKGEPEANLKLAFQKFADDLNVVALLDPAVLMCDRPEEELVMMYVASIKNAMSKAAAPQPTGNKLEEANDFYEQALTSTAKHSRKTKENSDNKYKVTVAEFTTVGISDKDRIQEIIAEAVTDVYERSEEGFEEAHGLYDKAIACYGELPGNPEQDKIDEVTKAKKKSDSLPLKYRKDLYEDLLKAANKWERQALMRDGQYIFLDTCTTTETYMDSVRSYVDEHLPSCKNEAARIAVKNSAVTMVENTAAPGFDLATDRYNEAKELCEKNKDKVVIDSKIKDINNKMDQYKREMEHYVNSKINEIIDTEAATAEDILAVYHQFTLDCAESINCLRPVGQLDDMGDADVPRRKGAAAYHLGKLLEVVKNAYARDCALRKELHIGTDALFDKECMPL